MGDGFWSNMLLNNLYIPIIIAIFGIAIKIVQNYADKFVEMFVNRQKTESMEKIASTREKLVSELDKTVEAAVASNMDMADQMKKAGHKLTEEQIKEINDSAKMIIMRTLPTEISGMTPADILGGDDVMNAMINSLMEKYVLEYKIKRGMSTTQEPVCPVTVPEEQTMQEYDMATDDLPFYMGSEETAPEVYTSAPVQEFIPDPVPEEMVHPIIPEEEIPAAPVDPYKIDVSEINVPFFNDKTFGGVG